MCSFSPFGERLIGFPASFRVLRFAEMQIEELLPRSVDARQVKGRAISQKLLDSSCF